ncbi:MAG: polyamine aminopropyltransferase [Candidatus Loosdrechtia sp.]|uniref:polyamine aminopropyltransferase n=1 Tax=Candidatus Loosdrechtia sp. TaxID=3101272 RepID=UPI003A6E67D6|nr:MAG: polyamine aminopropyltransferase [Candidatus Jettenia sp. AMX2]
MEKTLTNWIDEYFNRYELHRHAVKQIVYQAQTEIQKITIADTYNYGRCLILNDKFQTAEVDEFIYHEALVQPSLILHPHAESVLVIGGCDGATLREVLRHKLLKKAVMVDIDKEMVECAKKFLPSFHAGAFDDNRAELVIENGRKYLKQTKEQFDVIIMDVKDLLPDDSSRVLYSLEFYQIAAERVKEGGIMIVQSGAASLAEDSAFASICNTLGEVFSHVFPYVAYIPSYALQWGFAMATHNPGNLDITSEEIDNKIVSGITGNLRFYDSITHHALFNLPKYLRLSLQKQKRIIRDKEPVIYHSHGTL